MAVPTTIIGPDADKMAHILSCDGCAECMAPGWDAWLPKGLRVGDVVGSRKAPGKGFTPFPGDGCL